LCQLNSERTHQAAIAIVLLKEPRSFQWLARDPIQQEGVNLRANRFHEITGEAIPGRCVRVPEP
jgi:hypothetical protein